MITLEKHTIWPFENKTVAVFLRLFVSSQFDLPAEEFADCLPDGELLTVPLLVEEKNDDTSRPGALVPSPSLDFNDNEDIPTELSDSSETHDEGNCSLR